MIFLGRNALLSRFIYVFLQMGPFAKTRRFADFGRTVRSLIFQRFSQLRTLHKTGRHLRWSHLQKLSVNPPTSRGKIQNAILITIHSILPHIM